MLQSIHYTSACGGIVYLSLIQKRLAIMSMVSYMLFAIIVTSVMVLTDFKLEGY
jgi:hypothetical protein